MAVALSRWSQTSRRTPRPCRFTDAHGFTLIELVVVLTIIGIVSAYIAVKWKPQGDFTVSQQADRLAAHIRHVQSLAVAWDLPLRLSTAAGSYDVRCLTGITVAPCVAVNDIVRDPATGKLLSIAMDHGATLSGTTTDFDLFGRPCTYSDPNCSLLSTTRNFTVAFGAKSYVIAVSPITGYVTVTP